MPTAPIMKSLALEVEIVTVAAVPAVPEADLGIRAFESKGETVFAPDIPKATPAPKVEPESVIVMVTVPLEDQIAYQVSRSLVLEKATLNLRVQVKLGLEVMLLTVKLFPSTTETYSMSLLLVVVNDIVIVVPALTLPDAEPSSPGLATDEAEAQISNVV